MKLNEFVKILVDILETRNDADLEYGGGLPRCKSIIVTGSEGDVEILQQCGDYLIHERIDDDTKGESVVVSQDHYEYDRLNKIFMSRVQEMIDAIKEDPGEVLREELTGKMQWGMDLCDGVLEKAGATPSQGVRVIDEAELTSVSLTEDGLQPAGIIKKSHLEATACFFVKDPDEIGTMIHELELDEETADRYFEYHEYCTIEVRVDDKLNVVGGRIVPKGKQ